MSRGILLFLFLLLSFPVLAGEPEVRFKGNQVTVKGNGADLSEVLIELFPGRQVHFSPERPCISVDGQYSGTLDKVKKELEKDFTLKFDGNTQAVHVTLLESDPNTTEGFSIYKDDDNNWVLVATNTKFSALADGLDKRFSSIEKIEYSKAAGKVTVKDVSVEDCDISKLMRKLDKKVSGIQGTQNNKRWSFIKVKEKTSSIWTLRNIDFPTASRTTDLITGEGTLESQESKPVADLLNYLLDKEEDELAKAFGQQIVLKGDSEEVREAERVLATKIDVPKAQVALDIWALQMNTELSRSKKFSERIGRVSQGYAMTRYLQTRVVTHISRYIRIRWNKPLANKNANAIRQETLRAFELVGYDPDPDRDLSPVDTLILFALVEHSETQFQKIVLKALTNDIDNLRETLPQKGERAESLNRLLDGLENGLLSSKFAKTRTAYGVNLTTSQRYTTANDSRRMLGFLSAHLDLENPPGWREDSASIIDEVTDAKVLVRRRLEADMLLRRAVRAVAFDMGEMFTEPLVKWTHEELRDVTDLSIASRSQIVVDSRNLAELGADAVSFHPRTPVTQKEETDFAKVVKAADPTAAAIDILLQPKPLPIFTRISPGVSLSVVPSVTDFADQAHLDFRLKMAVEADKQDFLQENGIKPADMVKSASLKTNATVVGFDLLQLATISLTDVRTGDPWGIPVLEDIPLVGPLLFRYKGRPVRKHKEVLMFVQATIVPRAANLVAQ